MPAVTNSTDRAASLAAPLAAALAQRGLAAPALLFVAGHRPLAFAAGQLLAAAAPVAALLGLPQALDWARLLSDPAAVDCLQAALEREERGPR